MSVAIMQVLRLYCNCANGTFFKVVLLGLPVAIMHVNVSVAIIQLELPGSTYACDSFCIKYMGDNFYCIYAGGGLCCIYAGGTFCSGQLFIL